jgi:hypothetical protein
MGPGLVGGGGALMIGPERPMIRSPAIARRNKRIHHGVRCGVSGVLASRRSNSKAGNRTCCGDGGVARKRNQIAGKAASAKRIAGDANDKSPIGGSSPLLRQAHHERLR